MKTEDLEFFIDLAESHSMSKTAEKYYTSHQVVRKAIQRLENELNAQLLYTSNQGVTYTDAGSLLYHKAKIILQNLDEMHVQMDPYKIKRTRGEKQRISIALTPYLTEDMMLKVLNAYQLKHSEVDVRIKSCSVANGVQSVKTEQDVFIFPSVPEAVVDLAQTLQELNLEAHCIASSPLYVVASAKSEWGRLSMIDLEQANQLPLLLPANRSQYENMLQKAMTSEQVVNSVESLKNLVGMNVGIGLVTEKEFAYYFADAKKFALVPTNISNVSYYAILCKGQEVSKQMRSVLKEIASHL